MKKAKKTAKKKTKASRMTQLPSLQDMQARVSQAETALGRIKPECEAAAEAVVNDLMSFAAGEIRRLSMALKDLDREHEILRDRFNVVELMFSESALDAMDESKAPAPQQDWMVLEKAANILAMVGESPSDALAALTSHNTLSAIGVLRAESVKLKARQT